MSQKPIAIIRASLPRRAMGLAVLWGFAVLLLWLAMTRTYDQLIGQLLMAAAGLGALWLGEMMRRATARELWLTETVLCDDRGTILARLDEVEAVERGAFALKPSNGFVLRLAHPVPRGWQPGLWWRMGRRVGVGGVTSAGQAKAVADLINLHLFERKAM